MSTLRAILFALAFGSLVGSRVASAQELGPGVAAGSPRLPLGAALVDLSIRSFDKSDGLQSPTVYSVSVDLTGRLWIGTELGPMYYDGDRWRAEAIPASVRATQTRGVLQSSDSTLWFATRSGVIRKRGATAELFDVAGGLPHPVVYSIIETRALNGTPQVVVGTGAGIAVFDGVRFQALALPDSLLPEGLMLGESRAPDGSLELWLASSAGKVGRFSRNSWTVFGPRQGLASLSAEVIVPTPNGGDTRVLVAGESGVYAFHDDGPRGARFERVAGSPRLAYRVQEVVRVDGSRELWVGTLNGVVLRRRDARWDTVNVSAQQPGGRVTALAAVRGHAGGMGVYVGTYGGRLARVGISSVGSLETRGTRRDVMMAVLPETAADGRMSFWMGTGNAGLVHLDASGRLTEVSRETGAAFSQISAIGSLFSGTLPTARADSETGSPELWIGTEAGAFRREGSRFVKQSRGMENLVVRAFIRGPLPDGTTNLLAATDLGVYRWSADRWEHVRELGKVHVQTMTVARDARGSTLWLGLPAGVASATRGSVAFDTAQAAFGVGTSAAGRPQAATLRQQGITSVCSDTGADSTARVFAGTVTTGLWWRTASSPWQAVPAELQRRWGMHIRALHCLGDGRLLVAASQGLIVLDAVLANPASWILQSVASQEDGLPATEIQSFAPAVANGVMWIGTSRGIGALQLRRISTPPAPRLFIDLRSDGRPLEWNNSPPLEAGTSDLTIRPVLLTYHREEDTRYRVHLHHDGESSAALDSLHAGTIDDSLSWTEAPEAQYRALSEGHYKLRVWARDYAGRIIPLPVVDFRVVPPVWRTWWAILFYSLFAAAAIYVAHRWRLHTLERTNAALATSERNMRASERKFRALFDEAFDGHLLIDGPHVTSINAPAREFLGLPRVNDSASWKSTELHEWRSVLPPVVVNEIEALAVHGEMREYDFRRPDGTVIPLSGQITAVALDDRTLWHLVLQDLRATREAEEVRERLEEQVRDAQKLESLGTLAGGVAHDFNNLLGVIRGNVELALDTLHDRDAVATYLGTVFDASDRARDLVRQILTFSRRSSSREESVDLARLTRELYPMLRSMIPTSVDIVVDVPESSLFVRGDSTQLQQILLNLSSNAEYSMRAMGGGQLHLSLDVTTDAKIKSPGGRAARLRVSDSGVGMTAEVLERVFEPFFTTKPTGEGTGLGLAVLHGIVASHGGRVLVSSTPGAGTTFEILLPAALEAFPAPAGIVPALAPRPSMQESRDLVLPTEAPDAVEGRCIVLVDDEPAVARVSESALSRLGYRVITFHDPAAALAFVRKDPHGVDLVITDQTMPVLTGDVLASELQSLRPELPVIISTGFSYVLTPDRLAEIGSPAVLQKPVSLKVLRSAVEAALAERMTR
ncbi:MAG: response regulator [Phycisphaerae bacterium]|nr:response regulator [Gemmatimonadaceae bacterium]